MPRRPRRPRRPEVVRPPRPLLRAIMLSVAAIVIAAVGFIGGRATSTQPAQPAAAKHIYRSVTPAVATPHHRRALSTPAPCEHGLRHRAHRRHLPAPPNAVGPAWPACGGRHRGPLPPRRRRNWHRRTRTAASRLRGIDAGSAAAANAAPRHRVHPDRRCLERASSGGARPQPQRTGRGDGCASPGERRRRRRLCRSRAASATAFLSGPPAPDDRARAPLMDYAGAR